MLTCAAIFDDAILQTSLIYTPGLFPIEIMGSLKKDLFISTLDEHGDFAAIATAAAGAAWLGLVLLLRYALLCGTATFGASSGTIPRVPSTIPFLGDCTATLPTNHFVCR